MKNKKTILTNLIGGLLFATASLTVQASDVTIAYQTIPNPAQVAQADHTYEKATGLDINWKKFDAGSEVIAAIASGDVQIAYLGSSPYTVAATQKLPVEIFLIASYLGNSEALVVNDKIKKPQDLIGKTIATPFVSTSHYSLLSALKHWKIDPKKVNIINLTPPATIAAWTKNDIDGTYTWDPALGVAKKNGHVLITSGEVGKNGAPTFDAWLVNKDFAKKHPDAIKAFSKITLDAYDNYQNDPSSWLANKDNVKKLVKITGAKAEDIPELLQGNSYPVQKEQKKALNGSVVKAITDTAKFLKEQHRVNGILKDYSSYVTDAYLPK